MPGPQRRHQLHRGQILGVQEGEDQVQDVAEVPGSQLMNDVVTVVDKLDHCFSQDYINRILHYHCNTVSWKIRKCK